MFINSWGSLIYWWFLSYLMVNIEWLIYDVGVCLWMIQNKTTRQWACPLFTDLHLCYKDLCIKSNSLIDFLSMFVTNTSVMLMRTAQTPCCVCLLIMSLLTATLFDCFLLSGVSVTLFYKGHRLPKARIQLEHDCVAVSRRGSCSQVVLWKCVRSIDSPIPRR